MTAKGTTRKPCSKKRRFRGGEHIHIGVTQDFTETATEFFAFCKTYHFNPAEVVRNTIQDWLDTQKKLQGDHGKSESYQHEVVSEIVRDHPWLKGTLKA